MAIDTAITVVVTLGRRIAHDSPGRRAVTGREELRGDRPQDVRGTAPK
ncbi:hypothetical protein [Streptomyces sp. NPDC101165]